MLTALRGMASVLKMGGRLLVDSRNWERLRAERPAVSALEPRMRGGQRCLPLYLWTIPEAWSQPHGTEIVLVFDHGERVLARRYPLRFHPFRVADLRKRLAAVGLEVILDDYAPAKDRYSVIAEKPTS